MAAKKKRSHAAKARAKAAATTPVVKPISSSRSAGMILRRAVIAIVVVLAICVASVAAYRWSHPAVPAVGSGAATSSPARTVAVADYVGGSGCFSCHEKQHAAWKGSDHDLAMQVADDKSVLGDFGNARFSYAGTTSTFTRRDGRYIVNTDGPDGKLADFEIKYTFGVRPLQQYLIELPGGRKQALGIAWDSRSKAQGGQRWFHLYPGQNIKAGDPLHWTGVGQNWNFQCAECHSTNLRKNFDAKTAVFDTKWSEINVSCEACHGAGSNHVAWARKTGDWHAFEADKGLSEPLDERKGVQWIPVAETGNARRSTPRTTTRELDTCARCHSRASRISDSDPHGRPLLDTRRLTLLDENLYWTDGQMREEVYNWGAFAQSRMNAHGVTCSDCHDPHSLKLKADGNAVCAQCHQAAKYDDVKHTHHAAGTAGTGCVDCHMATTTYMIVDPRHDHSLRIPRPDVSARLGMPNACNQCHSGKTAQWAADAIAQWTGEPPGGFQNFADALHAGTVGSPTARGALLTLIEDKAQPAIVRASAIQRLGRLLTPATMGAVTQSLADPDALVRLAAVEALGNAAPQARRRFVPRMLDDPVLAVRIEAARVLAGGGERELNTTQRAAFDKALAEYVQAQTYNADRPEGQTSLGNLYAMRGDPAAAIAAFGQAIKIDPTFLAAYTNLADLHRARGSDAEAVTVLREGLARNPRAAVLHHVMGLALVRQKRTEDGLKELRSAAQLAPDNARFAYVYAVALNDAGRAGEAMQVLDAALKRDPYDRDVLSGLAFFNARAGDRPAALRYVAKLQELEPESQEYAQMAKSIAEAPPRR